MKTNANRATFLASLGAGLEYYDFIIYGLMAVYLGPLFFGAEESWISLLKIFGVFAVGYLTRPLGGLFFGMMGDTFGRKSTFVSVMLLMAVSTIAIGLLPTYKDVGALSAVLLIILRMVQGLSFGAELPGAITVVCEYAEVKDRGCRSGFVVSSVSVGSMLASFVLYLLTSTMNQEAILAWGWRIPFILGGSLAIVNYFIRLYLDETPEYLKDSAGKPPMKMQEPLLILLKLYLPQIFTGIGMTLLLSSLVIFVLYLPTYLSLYYHYLSSDVYLAMTGGLFWVALILPVAGLLADRCDKALLFRRSSLLISAAIYPLFWMLESGTLFALMAFMVIVQTGIALLTVCYFPLLAALFPTIARYTGIAASYNISYSLMAASPLMLTALIHLTGYKEVACLFLILCGLISAFSIKNK
jgi:MHS family proline/betaine transporter-like MFS transporter